MSQDRDEVLPKGETIAPQKVIFNNRYGIALAGDRYLPKERANSRLAASSPRQGRP